MSDGIPPYPPYPPAPPPGPPHIPPGGSPPPAWQPPPYGYGEPSEGWPPEAPKPKHTGAVVLAIVGSVAIFLAGIGIAAWATFGRTTGPSYPDDWDPRVSDIAQFVQTERGVLFDHPVEVEFLSEDEFKADVTTSQADLDDDDRKSLDQSASLLRALGLAEGDIDLFEKQNQLSGEGTAAYYDPEAERIRVRGTELTPEIKVTLAHEMTHALQDQFVDLEEVESSLDEDEVSRYRAVVEGDATNVEDAYAEKELSASEHDEYVDQRQQTSDDVDFTGIPPAMVAFFEAPYVIGPSFDRIVKEERGASGLNGLLRTPPASDAQLLNPDLYLRDREPENVDVPSTGADREQIEEGEFGAFDWYVVLASRLDPKRSLHLVDGWAGDSYRSYEGDNGACVTARFRGESGEATTAMATGLREWAAFSPAGAATVTDVDPKTVELTSCDPGADATSSAPTSVVDDLLAAPASRLAIAADLMDQLDLELDDAWCVASGIVDEFTNEELASSELSAEAEQAVSSVMAGCGVERN